MGQHGSRSYRILTARDHSSRLLQDFSHQHQLILTERWTERKKKLLVERRKIKSSRKKGGSCSLVEKSCSLFEKKNFPQQISLLFSLSLLPSFSTTHTRYVPSELHILQGCLGMCSRLAESEHGLRHIGHFFIWIFIIILIIISFVAHFTDEVHQARKGCHRPQRQVCRPQGRRCEELR